MQASRVMVIVALSARYRGRYATATRHMRWNGSIRVSVCGVALSASQKFFPLDDHTSLLAIAALCSYKSLHSAV